MDQFVQSSVRELVSPYKPQACLDLKENCFEPCEISQSFHEGLMNSNVIIDDVTHLGKCPITGDWRFFTVASDTDDKPKYKSAGSKRGVQIGSGSVSGIPLPSCSSQLCSDSASARNGRRRRRYGSLKLEDMGIKTLSEMPSSTSLTFSHISDEGGDLLSFVTPKLKSASSVKDSLLQTAEFRLTSSSEDSEDERQLSSREQSLICSSSGGTKSESIACSGYQCSVDLISLGISNSDVISFSLPVDGSKDFHVASSCASGKDSLSVSENSLDCPLCGFSHSTIDIETAHKIHCDDITLEIKNEIPVISATSESVGSGIICSKDAEDVFQNSVNMFNVNVLKKLNSNDKSSMQESEDIISLFKHKIDISGSNNVAEQYNYIGEAAVPDSGNTTDTSSAFDCAATRQCNTIVDANCSKEELPPGCRNVFNNFHAQAQILITAVHGEKQWASDLQKVSINNSSETKIQPLNYLGKGVSNCGEFCQEFPNPGKAADLRNSFVNDYNTNECTIGAGIDDICVDFGKHNEVPLITEHEGKTEHEVKTCNISQNCWAPVSNISTDFKELRDVSDKQNICLHNEREDCLDNKRNSSHCLGLMACIATTDDPCWINLVGNEDTAREKVMQCLDVFSQESTDSLTGANFEKETYVPSSDVCNVKIGLDDVVKDSIKAKLTEEVYKEHVISQAINDNMEPEESEDICEDINERPLKVFPNLFNETSDTLLDCQQFGNGPTVDNKRPLENAALAVFESNGLTLGSDCGLGKIPCYKSFLGATECINPAPCQSFSGQDTALLVHNDWNFENSEYKAFHLNSNEIVDNKETQDPKLHEYSPSRNQLCSSRIPQFVGCDFSSSSSLLNASKKGLDISLPLKLDKALAPGNVFSDGYDAKENRNVSLLSWLRQNSCSGSLSSTGKPRAFQSPSSSLSLLSVTTQKRRSSSLPDNHVATVDLKTQPDEDQLTYLAHWDPNNSATVVQPCSPFVPGVSRLEGSKSEDELDISRSAGAAKAPKRGSVPAIGSTAGRTGSTTSKSSSSTAVNPVKKRHSLAAGSSNAPVCVDEEIFVKQFDQVTKFNIFSAKELTERVTKIRETLSDPNVDWSKRMDVMKELRACFFAGAKHHSDFVQQLTSLEISFQASVKDLRSQVVREACITISFMAQELGKEFGHFAESVLPSLISQIPNSAKVMASSATICIRFILQHTHIPRLIPIITGNQTSKSSIIRKQCFEFLYQIVHAWPTHVLERHIAVLQDAIKRGIGDADSDARVSSRKAFWAFSEHFKGQADSLLSSLDISKQRQLIGEQQSNSSSNTSLNSIGRSLTSGSLSHKSYKTRSASTERGPSNIKARCSSALGQPIHRNGSDCYARPRKTSLVGGGATSTQQAPSTDRSRSRSRVGASQSQPGSRSNSPAARLSYITHIQPDVVPSSHGISARGKSKIGITKSQGNSREGSPTRVYGRERRLSGHAGVNTKPRGRPAGPQRVLLQGEDSEAAVADALHRPKGRGSSDNYDSDDAASETSSTCSDGSYWACGRQLTEDMSEIIACLSSGAWGDRRDGLLALQNLLNNNRTLTRSELKKVTDIFSRMFHDPHGKVFSVFMETLVDLVMVHHDDLNDWLYVLLTRLLNKTGADLLASVQAKVQRALEVVRGAFPSNSQFLLLSKFLIDQTQSPNLKVKVSMLMYLHGLIQLMSPSDFSNTSDIRLAVSRIITWTTEPKSVDVRKAAQAVLIALYNLNTPEFSVMLSVLPKTFQEGANRILLNRLRGSGQDSDGATPRGGTTTSTPQSSSFRYKISPSGRLTKDGPGGGLLNTDDIYNSIRQTTDDIHNLIRDDTQGEKKDRAIASSVRSPGNTNAFSSARTPESRVPTFLHNSAGKPWVKEEFKSLDDQRLYAKGSFLERENFGLKTENCTVADESYYNEELKTGRDLIQDILVELSNHNERDEERKSALLVLMKKAREEGSEVWDEYFNAVLLMLLETLGDNDGHIRALTLRDLAEFLRCMPDRFHDYVELTTMRTLECHKDPVKEVTRAAEECITLIARIVLPSRCHGFLKPLIECEDFPVNLAAIKMFTQVIEEHQKDDVIALLPEMIPGLLKGYDNVQSSVRKASVVCLVAIYLCVGEALRPFLQDLHGSKVKLLNVYIKKALEEKAGGSNSCATSKASSPTSMGDA